jgi:hypothetical protein
MNICIVKNTTPSLLVEASNSATGLAFDLTGYVMKMAIEKYPTDATPVATISANIELPATGKGVFKIVTTTFAQVPPGNYKYHVFVETAPADPAPEEPESPAERFTVIQGNLELLPFIG